MTCTFQYLVKNMLIMALPKMDLTGYNQIKIFPGNISDINAATGKENSF